MSAARIGLGCQGCCQAGKVCLVMMRESADAFSVQTRPPVGTRRKWKAEDATEEALHQRSGKRFGRQCTLAGKASVFCQ